MAQIPMTDREMKRAWRQNLNASSGTPRRNAHRLLLFYSVECGLKTILMRDQRRNRTDICPELKEVQHNINRLMDILRMGSSFRLPRTVKMRDIKNNRNDAEVREIPQSKINQMWRYGGEAVEPTDIEIENALSRVSDWIKRELRI